MNLTFRTILPILCIPLVRSSTHFRTSGGRERPENNDENNDIIVSVFGPRPSPEQRRFTYSATRCAVCNTIWKYTTRYIAELRPLFGGAFENQRCSVPDTFYIHHRRSARVCVFVWDVLAY